MKSAVVLMLLLGTKAAAGDEPAMDVQVCQESREGQAALTALSAAGIAAGEVQDRLLEWQAKGASAARCGQLLTAFAGAAGQAHAALVAQGVTLRPELVLAATDTLLAGASREHLEHVVIGAGSPTVAMARASALTTLLSQGFAPGASSDAISLAVERGYHDSDLVLLASSAGRLAREGGASHEVVLGHIGSALREGVSARELLPHLQQALHTRGAEHTPSPQNGFDHLGGAAR